MSNTDKLIQMHTEYMGAARKLLADGFTSKAAQKRASEQLTRALECVVKMIRYACADIAPGDRTPEQDGIYWMLPMYPHQLKAGPIRDAVAAHLPSAVQYASLLQAVRELHAEIKAAPANASRTITDRTPGLAAAMDVPVVGATFRHKAGVLIITLQDGRTVRRITTRRYKWVTIVERDGVLHTRHASTVGIQNVRNEIAREFGYRESPMMIAQAM